MLFFILFISILMKKLCEFGIGKLLKKLVNLAIIL
ncbi:hypothetical protein HMPREF9431_00378 [Segatella oulorum F0390]|uniref:Uncharacterized protein n=1 Tax=Segatella oulorum F0390 TaxID=702438 RepID=G1W977_9BACT|nr:hypothetical protein HMPREF9431_00378 [Segatella oulorum F0390]